MIRSTRCKIITFLFLFSLYILCVLGCSSIKEHICIRDGREYCVTNDYVPLDTWDACYRRGISCMEGKCWEYAIEEFNRAIQLSFKDERNVRAYGMHFRDEYFPHRELGISYFYFYLSELKKDPGKLEKALYELKLSIDQTPSARAKYYLNQVRRSHLLATGQDVLPPVIHLEWAQEEYLTKQTPFKITGTVKDDQFTAAVSINNAPLFIELAEEEIPFAYPVDLKEGWNRIEVVARDLVDREGKKSIRVYLDRQGPLVISNPIQEDQIPITGQITVSALIYDRSGIISFKLNHKEVPRYGLDELCFIEEKVSLVPGVKGIPFLTQDRAGNIARGEISIISSRRRLNLALRLACLDTNDHLTYLAMTANESEDEDISLKIIYPEITDPEKDRIYTYHQEIFLEAEIDAHYGIKKIETTLEGIIHPPNGTCRLEIPSGINEISEIKKNKAQRLSRQLKKQNYDPEKGIQKMDAILQKNTFYYLNQRIPLCRDFTHQILTVAAVDHLGNPAIKRIRILKVSRHEILKSEEQLELAIFPFGMETNDLYSKDRQDYIYKTLHESFIKQGRFNLLEKDELPWRLIEKECQSGRICEEEVVRTIAGRTTAEGIICGGIKKWMDGGVEIKALFREPEQGEVCLLHDVFSLKDNVDDIRTILNGLAMKFRDSFPTRIGEIIEIDGQLIQVNIGSKKGILPCMRYNVFQTEEELLNRAIVKDVEEESSRAKVIEEDRSREIERGFRVRTR